MIVKPVEKRIAQEVVVKNHYLHRKTNIQYAFGLFEDDALVGVITFGTPPSRHLQMSACPSDPSMVIELNRLWVSDAMPRNTESWFISRALALLPPLIVVSYADTAHDHQGFVYRASNFNYAGWTDMERKTPRFDYVPTNGKHSRDAFRSNSFTRVRRRPKVKYWIITGNPTERRKLLKICGWPKLSWKELPPPSSSI
jgi:hypothetical protein